MQIRKLSLKRCSHFAQSHKPKRLWLFLPRPYRSLFFFPFCIWSAMRDNDPIPARRDLMDHLLQPPYFRERKLGPTEIKGHVPWVSQNQELLCNGMATCARVPGQAPLYRGGREGLSAGPRSITVRAESNSGGVRYPAGCYPHLHLGRQSSTHRPEPREYLSAGRRLLAGGDKALSGTSRAAQTSA